MCCCRFAASDAFSALRGGRGRCEREVVRLRNALLCFNSFHLRGFGGSVVNGFVLLEPRALFLHGYRVRTGVGCSRKGRMRRPPGTGGPPKTRDCRADSVRRSCCMLAQRKDPLRGLCAYWGVESCLRLYLITSISRYWGMGQRSRGIMVSSSSLAVRSSPMAGRTWSRICSAWAETSSR